MEECEILEITILSKEFFSSLKTFEILIYLVLLNFTKWWNVIECYMIYIFLILRLWCNLVSEISVGGIGFKIYPILNGRINIPESNASSILLRCMLFYMDSRIDLHEWKDEERVWNASSLDGKITIANVFLYRLCISYPPVGKIFLEYDWNCWVHFWIMVIIL